jgi:putative addiction module component (TIGR02574 family)
MPRTFEEVRNEALALTAEERGHLGEELLDSVESDEGNDYASEIQRRVAEIDAGTAQTIDSDESIANAQRLLNDARQTSSRR